VVLVLAAVTGATDDADTGIETGVVVVLGAPALQPPTKIAAASHSVLMMDSVQLK
jgi:hypothetical protein